VREDGNFGHMTSGRPNEKEAKRKNRGGKEPNTPRRNKRGKKGKNKNRGAPHEEGAGIGKKKKKKQKKKRPREKGKRGRKGGKRGRKTGTPKKGQKGAGGVLQQRIAQPIQKDRQTKKQMSPFTTAAEARPTPERKKR